MRERSRVTQSPGACGRQRACAGLVWLHQHQEPIPHAQQGGGRGSTPGVSLSPTRVFPDHLLLWARQGSSWWATRWTEIPPETNILVGGNSQGIKINEDSNRMRLKSIRLSERSQVPKGTHCLRPFVGNTQTGKSAQSGLVAAWGWGRGAGSGCLTYIWFPFGVLQICWNYITVDYCMPLKYSLENGEFGGLTWWSSG